MLEACVTRSSSAPGRVASFIARDIAVPAATGLTPVSAGVFRSGRRSGSTVAPPIAGDVVDAAAGRAIGWGVPMRALCAALTGCVLLSALPAFAHGVAEGDKGYIQEITGVHLLPFAYLGAKHMVTGYDHLLFLLGVVFFLYRLKDVALYVSLFAAGHSATMLLGVYMNVGVSSYLIDAIIGVSVVYKALDNLGAFQRWLGFQPDTKTATLVFGLFHGFGLATKVIEYNVSPDGLVPNLLAFNVGVEIGQLLALAGILIAMSYWRRTASFWRHAYTANVVVMTAGFVLTGYQLAGWFVFS